MTNPLNIPELKCIIISMLDLKSIGSMIQVDRSTYQLVSSMSIYKELIICLNHIYIKGQKSQKIQVHVHRKNFCICLFEWLL